MLKYQIKGYAKSVCDEMRNCAERSTIFHNHPSLLECEISKLEGLYYGSISAVVWADMGDSVLAGIRNQFNKCKKELQLALIQSKLKNGIYVSDAEWPE